MKYVVIGGFILAFIEVVLFILVASITGPNQKVLNILLAGCITAALAMLLMIIDMIWKSVHFKQ